MLYLSYLSFQCNFFSLSFQIYLEWRVYRFLCFFMDIRPSHGRIFFINTFPRVLIVHNLLFFIFVAYQIYMQTKNIFLNQTIIESAFHESFPYFIHGEDEKFVNLFDQGNFNNFIQFWWPTLNFESLYSVNVSEVAKEKARKLNIECPEKLSVLEKITV
jgi:hypothetical protein